MANLHDFRVTDIDGKERSLSDYDGRVVLVVNVASKCGLTPQYDGLQRLYDLYRAKGLTVDEAELVAARLMQNPEHALDTKIREELGLDPDQLGSPWGAAAYSMVAFAVGAFVPLAPFLVSSGMVAIVLSVLLSLTALFIVGALVSLLTGRSLLFSGMRQMAIGGGAALVTFVVGTLIGITVA